MEKSQTRATELEESFSSKTSDADDGSSIVSSSKVSEPSLLIQDGTYLSRNLFKSAVSPPKKRDNETWPFNSSRFIEGIEPPCVKISHDGFEPENLSIMEGQTVTFLWEEYDEKLSFYQVVHDGEMPIPVRGGYSFMVPQEQISRRLFNLRAEYKFMLLNVKGPILTINVHDRIELEAHITNAGFQPDVIYITKGHSIIWKWDGNAIRHTVQEMLFCQKHSSFMAKNRDWDPERNPQATIQFISNILRGVCDIFPLYGRPVQTEILQYHYTIFRENRYYPWILARRPRRRPGIYYFRTESCILNKFHYCAVVVTETCREHKIEVLDEVFQPMILVIEEGETVWWQWSRAMCKRHHAIYQIKPPGLISSPDEPFEPMENGFAWLIPSIQGLMAHRFDTPGNYYFSDQNNEFSATFMGTIIVKSKAREHVIEVNAQTGFSNDLIHAQTNDRIWWLWKEKDRKDGKVSTINEIDRVLNPLAKSFSCSCGNKGDSLEEEETAILKTLGIGVVTLGTIGVYTYTVSCVQDIVSTCSVIVQASSKNHTVHITEDGFERHYLTIRVNDCVWWVWQNEKHPHNIVQVTYENEIVADGFCSGSVRDSPSSFMHQFTSPGVYYYKSNSLKKIGTIVVENKAKVQEVDVSIVAIQPDPILVNVNDILCWVFRGQRRYNVYEVSIPKRMSFSSDGNNEELTPRRCIAKVIDKSGLIHFASKSFLKQKGDKDGEIRLSSVIADIVEDGILIHVDKNGFHPSNIVIEKGQCIVWRWTESHNILHVNYSNETEISGVINGKNSFTSGKPICNSQYTYSFHCEGDFTVVSQGAIGYSCHIKVMKNAPKMATPSLKESNSQKYKQHGVVWLEHPMLDGKDSNVKIYFTFDGTFPHCYHETTMVYNHNEGILLEMTGLHVIRAVATCPGFLDSEVFNSRRINVVANRNKSVSLDTFQEKQSFESIENGPSEEVWEWWSCKPCMKIKKLEPGQILVTWELRDTAAIHLVKGYKLYINDVAYNKMCHQNTNRLTVKGLAGGREYKLYLLAFSTLPNMKPVQSNTITLICPTLALSGGPLISLEWINGSNSLCIVWTPMEEFAVVDYWVYRDANRCGKKVTHDSHNKQCRVILEDWTTNLLTKVYIEAVPQVWNDMSFDPVQETRKTNVLEVKLPLLTKDFELSPLAKGPYPKEDYMEYITVIDDSPFPPYDNKKIEETEDEEEEETETEEDDEEETETGEEDDDDDEEDDEEEEEEETEEDDNDGELSLNKTHNMDKLQSDFPGVTSLHSQKTEENLSQIPSLPKNEDVKQSSLVKETKEFNILLRVEDESQEHVLHLFWEESPALDAAYELENYTVNISGTEFESTINSNKRHECNIELGEKKVRGLQHCWDTQQKRKCSIKGLKPNSSYSISVIGTYKCRSHSNAEIMTCKSSVVKYKVKGPPGPPKLTSFEVDLYQVSFCIEPSENLYQKAMLKGFKLYIDSIYTGKLFKDPTERIIQKLEPGISVTLTAVTVADENLGESKQSVPIQVTCPHKPTAPAIKEESSSKKGCALISWSRPSNTEQQSISSYRIFLNDELYGEICTNTHSNKHGYQFLLTDLSLYQAYKVFVKSICGQKDTYSGSNHVFLMSDSVLSNILWIKASNNQRSPKLFIKKMSPEGIDIGWTDQQNEENNIERYQILKNGQTYGGMIPVDITDLQLRDVTLGERLTLQLIACKISQKVTTTEKDERHRDSENMEYLKKDIKTYENCEAGAQLVIHFTEFPQPPSKVWCEKVTGHSALIVWKKDEKLKDHFIHPESYVVSWWPSNKKDRNVRIDHTTEDHFVLSNLQYDTSYMVQVEGKVLKEYNEMKSDFLISGETCKEGDDHEGHTFPVLSGHQQITVKTAKPPEPPSSLGVVASTCCSVKIAWDPPREHGVEITSLYLQCQLMAAAGGDNDDNLPAEDEQFLCVRPDVKEAIFENLAEKSWYLMRIFAVTEEYFDWLPAPHRLKKLRYIPEGTQIHLEESIWLPFSTVCFQTSGTDPATNLQVSDLSFTSLTLTWVNAIVHGSNQVLKIVVKWVMLDSNKSVNEKEMTIGQHKVLPSDADLLTVNNLLQGTQYRFTVETVVRLRTSLDSETKDGFRTVNVASKPLLVTTRVSIETPKLYVERYSRSTVVLSWQTPSLMTSLGHDKNGNMLYLMCHLYGYQIKINDELHAQLWPNSNSCTLQKCKPGKKYKVQLIAMSSIQEKKKLKKWKLGSKVSSEEFWKSCNSQDSEINKTMSEPLEIILPPKKNGSVDHLDIAFFLNTNESEEHFGSLHVEWSSRNKNDIIKQFSVIWFAHDDQIVNTRVIKPHNYQCTIPVEKPKCLYEVNVKCELNTGEVTLGQPVQVITPGEPDPPEIILKSADSTQFQIGWQEPKTYGGEKITAYEIHVNNTIVTEVETDQFSYIHTCQPNCVYMVNVVALGSNPKFGNSPKSNTLIVNSSLDNKINGNYSNLITKMSNCQDFKNFLKATKVSDTCIYLDWSSYIAPDNIGSFKILWNSVAQPKEKEIVQNISNTHCVITKCLPGVTHYLQLVVINSEGKVIEKSSHLTVQTAAPPNTPVLNVRACNFHCISVQWTKPLEYGDAIICKYNVFVNDEVVSVQPPDQTSFTFTEGVPCADYTFQVQALTAYDNLPSKLSEPLTLTWSGVKPSNLKAECLSDSTVKVTWDSPYCTGPVRIKHFQVECFDAATGLSVHENDFIPADSQETRFHELKLGKYRIIQKIHVIGTNQLFCSEAVEVEVVEGISPPTIMVNVQGLERRKQLISMASHLINARDKLIRKKFLQNKNEKKSLDSTIIHVENNLQQFINELSLDTGKVHLDIEWEYVQPENESNYHSVEAYQIFVDGKLMETIKDVHCTRFHLIMNSDGRMHQVSMKTLSQHQSMISDESNIVDVATSLFLPFTCYCNSAVHRKKTRWPNPGCCQFADSFNLENRQRKKQLNPGLLPRLHPLPDCKLKNLVTDKLEALLPLATSNLPLLFLIWTPWCLPSQITMKRFAEFAEKNEELFSYISVCCDGEESADKVFLAKFLDENRWKEKRLIRHFSGNVESEERNSTSADFKTLLGIEEVPTFLILDVDGNLTWQGRYCAPNYQTFAAFLHHTIHEIFQRKNKNCNYCQMENDSEFVNQLLQDTSQFLERKFHPPRPKSAVNRSKKMLYQRKTNNTSKLQASFDDSSQEDILLDLRTESPQEIWGSSSKRRKQKLDKNKSKN